MEMRRLYSDADRTLIAEALSWVNDMPQFYRDADRAWGKPTVDQYLEMMSNDPQADFGVFQNEILIAVITVALVAKDVYNSHLMMKRGSDIQIVAIAAASVMKNLFANGMTQGFSWALKRNSGLQDILRMIGMRPDGLSQYKGQSHGQPLLWLRYAT